MTWNGRKLRNSQRQFFLNSNKNYMQLDGLLKKMKYFFLDFLVNNRCLHFLFGVWKILKKRSLFSFFCRAILLNSRSVSLLRKGSKFTNWNNLGTSTDPLYSAWRQSFKNLQILFFPLFWVWFLLSLLTEITKDDIYTQLSLSEKLKIHSLIEEDLTHLMWLSIHCSFSYCKLCVGRMSFISNIHHSQRLTFVWSGIKVWESMKFLKSWEMMSRSQNLNFMRLLVDWLHLENLLMSGTQHFLQFERLSSTHILSTSSSSSSSPYGHYNFFLLV